MTNPTTIKTLAKAFAYHGIDRAVAQQLGQLTPIQVTHYADLRQSAARNQWRAQVVGRYPMSAKDAIGYMLASGGVQAGLAAAMASGLLFWERFWQLLTPAALSARCGFSSAY